MSYERGDESPGQKRRKLDELFADEPYLSPTMKARRLHEKLHDQIDEKPVNRTDKRAEPATQGLPTTAYVRSASEPAAPQGGTPQDGTQLSETYWADSQGSDASRTVSLMDAAIFLRSKGAQVPRLVSVQAQTRLAAFRDGSLKNWIKGIQES